MTTEGYEVEDDYVEVFHRSTFWVRTCSTMMGTWPRHHDSSRRSWWYRRVYYCMIFMHWLNTYLQVEFVFRNLANLDLAVSALCSLGSIMSTGVKVMRLHSYKDEIEHVCNTMASMSIVKEILFLRKRTQRALSSNASDGWAEEFDTNTIFTRISSLFARQWREVYLNLRFYHFVVCLVPCIYQIIPIYSNLYNAFEGIAHNRSFVYNLYYPFLEPYRQRSPLFELLFCSESLSGFTTYAVVVAFDGLYVVVVLYATSLVHLLNEMQQETTNPMLTDGERSFFQRECILYHLRTKQFIEQINEIFSPVLLVQLVTSTWIICVIAFSATKQTDGANTQMLMVLYLIAAIYQLFQFCWYGQRLQNESIKLPDAVYDARWEICSKEFRSSHHILLQYSQQQLDMRAYTFSTMSLETFSTIIRSAVSYFTVLQTLAEK